MTPWAKPCPFCGEELVPLLISSDPRLPVSRVWRHPERKCFASLFEVEEEDVPLWNRRARK